MRGSPSAPAPGPSIDSPSCSIAAAVSILGDRWTLLILRDVFRGTYRFSELHANLGIAKNLLSDRLGNLVADGIVAKVAYQDRPPRHEYRLTAKGADFSSVLIALMRWGDRWYADDGAPIELIHRDCGQPLDQQVVCADCDQPLRPGEIRSRPGPGQGTEIHD